MPMAITVVAIKVATRPSRTRVFAQATAAATTMVTIDPATMGITTIVITIPETQTVNRTIISVREMEEDITMTIVPAIRGGIAHPDPV